MHHEVSWCTIVTSVIVANLRSAARGFAAALPRPSSITLRPTLLQGPVRVRGPKPVYCVA